jgi:hypothetical protein
MPSQAACAVTSGTRNTGRGVVRQTVILSYLGTFAGVHGTALQHNGYVHDEALCVRDLRPTSLSGSLLQVQERGVVGGDRFGKGEAEGRCKENRSEHRLSPRGSQPRYSSPGLHSSIEGPQSSFRGRRWGTRSTQSGHGVQESRQCRTGSCGDGSQCT